MEEYRNLELWYPKFEGVAYLKEPTNDDMIFAPYVIKREDGVYISKKIQGWNSDFIRITFIEVSNNEYEFICYEDQTLTMTPFSFGLYRSSMNQNGSYAQFKEYFNNNPRLQILHMLNLETKDGKLLGESLPVSKVDVIAEDDLQYKDFSQPIDYKDYPYCIANIAHLILNGVHKSDHD